MALREIHDPKSATPLVRALMDESPGVRWLAAEAIVAIGPDAITALLSGLKENFNSVWMQQGAHHVLSEFRRRIVLSGEIRHLLDLLSHDAPTEAIPLAVRAALLARSRVKQP